MTRTIVGGVVLAGSLLAAALLCGDPAFAAPDPEVEVGRGWVALRLGVPGNSEVDDVIRNDGRLSGGFEVLDPKSFPAALRKEGFDKKGWMDVGAQTVIKSKTAGGKITLSLYDMAKGKKPVLVRSFPADKPREAANKFMNAAVKYYTGTPGVFGSRIAFVRTRRSPTVSKNVFTAEMDGAEVAGITGNRSLNILPSLGPGGQVIFTSYAKRNPDLWMSAGSSPRRVSKQPGLNLGGAMSPNGGSIVLTLSKDGNSELYTIGTDGVIKARLTRSGAIDGSPTWNGAGNKIAFVSNRAGGPQVFQMSATGGGASRVSRSGSYNQTPDWSPGEGKHGQWIAYAGRSGGRMDIFKVHARSGKTVKLTSTGGRHTDPSWAPDGRLIAYSASRGGITIATADGNNPVSVIRAGTTPDWGPRRY